MKRFACAVVVGVVFTGLTAWGGQICQNPGFDNGLNYWTQWWASWGGNNSYLDTGNGVPAPCLGHSGGGSQGRYQRIVPPSTGTYTVWADWKGDSISWAEVMFFQISSGASHNDIVSRLDGGAAGDIAYKKDAWGMNPPTTWNWEDARKSKHPQGNKGTITVTSGNVIIVGTKLGNGGSLWYDNFEVFGEPTLALITSFEGESSGTDVVIRWQTAFELKTAGFYLERYDPDFGGYVRVNEDLIPASPDPAGATYEVVDPLAFPGATFSYRLIELETTGFERAYGPYDITIDGDGPSFEEWKEWMFTAEQLGDPRICGMWMDGDGDGQPNAVEYLCGTDPTDPNSAFRILDMRPVKDGMLLIWSSAEGRAYRVECAEGAMNAFRAVTDLLPAQPPINACVLPESDSGVSIYRIAVEP